MSKRRHTGLSRRDFIQAVGSTVLASGVGAPWSALAQGEKRYNILMIVTDQERYMAPSALPDGYRLPGHERLAARGVVFENHQIGSCVCTPSRAVIYTGQHIQNNRVFDNVDFPWTSDLSTEIPTIGDLLRRQGYYTAYKGKWHLTGSFSTTNDLHNPTRLLTTEMEEYGFSDYFGIGDIIAHHEGGFLHDGVVASMTRSWFRGRGRSLAADGQPWFMAVNLVNPHDVMHYNTDLPGQPERQAATAMLGLNREPSIALYEQRWDLELPVSRNQPTSDPGRPAAHEDFAGARAGLVGRVPNEDDRWRRLNDYYLNCIQDVDGHVVGLLDELEELGMMDDTIIVYTADHGELGGAHGISGKGATAYREQNHVPFIVAHPAFPGNRRCKAVTSHVDLAPTLVGLAGGDPTSEPLLVGQDISQILSAPEAAAPDALRPGALFNYNMLAYLDSGFLMQISEFIRGGGNPKELSTKGWRPDLRKRGAIRSVYDGRYKLNRYFSPEEHNTPGSLEALLADNDVELFDLAEDPYEMRNLALDRRGNGELLVAMNDKLNALIEAEVGEDIGQMLPDRESGDWALGPAVGRVNM